MKITIKRLRALIKEAAPGQRRKPKYQPPRDDWDDGWRARADAAHDLETKTNRSRSVNKVLSGDLKTIIEDSIDSDIVSDIERGDLAKDDSNQLASNAIEKLSDEFLDFDEAACYAYAISYAETYKDDLVYMDINPSWGNNKPVKNNTSSSPHELLSRELELAIYDGERKLKTFIDKVEAINPELVDGMWIQYAQDAIIVKNAEDKGREAGIGSYSSDEYTDMAVEDFEENYREVMK